MVYGATFESSGELFCTFKKQKMVFCALFKAASEKGSLLGLPTVWANFFCTFQKQTMVFCAHFKATSEKGGLLNSAPNRISATTESPLTRTLMKVQI